MSGQGSLAPVSSPESSSKVTCIPDCPRLGDLAHLLEDSPLHASTWGTLSWQLPAQDFWQWLPKCLQLLKHWWPWLIEQFSLSIFSSSKAMAANAHQEASCTTARAFSHHPSLTSLKGSYVVWILSWNLASWSGLEVPAGLYLSLSSGLAWSHLCWRHSLMESRISWQIFSSISASQGLLPGDLCSWYTSLYTPLISSLVDLRQMSWMVNCSEFQSDQGKGSHRPWQMAWSCSFLPVAWTCLGVVGGCMCFMACVLDGKGQIPVALKICP